MKELRIKDICTKGSSTLKQKDVEKLSGKYPVYGASGLIAKMDSYHQEKDYIAIVKDGSGIGRVMFLPAKSSVIGTMQYILPKEGYDIFYIGYCLQSLNLSSYKQGAAIPHIYFRDYGERIVKVTDSISEQKDIVNRINVQFSKIDKLKQNAEKELQEATAAFSIILDKTLTPPDCWEESTLKHLTTSLTDGDHLPPPKSKTGIPFITISNIDKINEVISFENTFYVPKSYYIDLKDSRKATVGDILYTVTGSFGIPILVTENREFCFQRHIALIKPDTDKILSKYLFYWLKSPRLQKIADKAATGAAQRTVSLTSLRQFPVLYPKNKEDQKTIIFQLDSAYDNFFTLKTNFDKITKECEALKQSILREIFD